MLLRDASPDYAVYGLMRDYILQAQVEQVAALVERAPHAPPAPRTREWLALYLARTGRISVPVKCLARFDRRPRARIRACVGMVETFRDRPGVFDASVCDLEAVVNG